VPELLPLKSFDNVFFWPIVINDATELVATCEACQKFSYRSKEIVPSPLWQSSTSRSGFRQNLSQT
jgi:hypothetical protein